jgi:hypothetical protein
MIRASYQLEKTLPQEVQSSNCSISLSVPSRKPGARIRLIASIIIGVLDFLLNFQAHQQITFHKASFLSTSTRELAVKNVTVRLMKSLESRIL